MDDSDIPQFVKPAHEHTLADILKPPTIEHKNAELVDLSGHSRARRAQVLAFIKLNPDVTRGMLVDKLGYGADAIDNDLSTMRRNALIVSSGKNPTKWRVME